MRAKNVQLSEEVQEKERVSFLLSNKYVQLEKKIYDSTETSNITTSKKSKNLINDSSYQELKRAYEDEINKLKETLRKNEEHIEGLGEQIKEQKKSYELYTVK